MHADAQSAKRGRFLDLKPVNWGKGTENASKEIDKLHYENFEQSGRVDSARLCITRT